MYQVWKDGIFSNGLKEGKVWMLSYRKNCIENSENPQKVYFGNVNYQCLFFEKKNRKILFTRPVQSMIFRLLVSFSIYFPFISRKERISMTMPHQRGYPITQSRRFFLVFTHSRRFFFRFHADMWSSQKFNT